MSAFINDFASAIAVHTAVAPAEFTDVFDGAAVDLIASDGECFAVQQVGAFEEGPTWTGRIEQSSDGSSWSAISGAAFNGVTEAADTQAIRFTRTARYVRYSASITGSDPELSLAVLIGQARKTF